MRQLGADCSTGDEKVSATHPVEVISACNALQRNDGRKLRIAARKPHLPYLCGYEWFFLPPVASPAQLVMWAQQHGVDYVAFGIAESAARPALAPLADPANAPPGLRAVWAHHGRPMILYQIIAPTP